MGQCTERLPIQLGWVGLLSLSAIQWQHVLHAWGARSSHSSACAAPAAPKSAAATSVRLLMPPAQLGRGGRLHAHAVWSGAKTAVARTSRDERLDLTRPNG